jgi:putative transcriptional regulator
MIKLRLDEVLKEKGVSQSELSDLSGVRRARINRICNRDVDRLELKHINAICNALDVPPQEWIVWKKDESIE